MAVFRQVKMSFWTDPLVSDNFSAEDKYFFLYLLTNLHTNLCGCYEVSKTQVAKEMGYSEETINSLIDRFENKYNLIRYEKKTYELLILNWSKHNWTESPKFRKLVEKEIESIKDKEFKKYLTGIFNGEDAEIYPISTSDTVSEVPDTSLLVSVTDTVSVNDNSSSIDTKKRVRKKNEDTEEFKAFWDAYPRHANKPGARTEFAKADVPLETLLDSIEQWKKTDQWSKDDGQYIPYPAKWLKERRWEDTPVAKAQPKNKLSNLQRLYEETEDE